MAIKQMVLQKARMMIKIRWWCWWKWSAWQRLLTIIHISVLDYKMIDPKHCLMRVSNHSALSWWEKLLVLVLFWLFWTIQIYIMVSYALVYSQHPAFFYQSIKYSTLSGRDFQNKTSARSSLIFCRARVSSHHHLPNVSDIFPSTLLGQCWQMVNKTWQRFLFSFSSEGEKQRNLCQAGYKYRKLFLICKKHCWYLWL